jgi:hypothetical protein
LPPNPTSFLKKKKQKILTLKPKIAHTRDFDKVFVKLFSKSLWGFGGKAPENLKIDCRAEQGHHLISL